MTAKELEKRCRPCKYRRRVTANAPSWSFIGCYHAPYHGRWIAEIKECPKGAKQCGVDAK